MLQPIASDDSKPVWKLLKKNDFCNVMAKSSKTCISIWRFNFFSPFWYGDRVPLIPNSLSPCTCSYIQYSAAINLLPISSTEKCLTWSKDFNQDLRARIQEEMPHLFANFIMKWALSTIFQCGRNKPLLQILMIHAPLWRYCSIWFVTFSSQFIHKP
jgi:hypothetical protein